MAPSGLASLLEFTTVNSVEKQGSVVLGPQPAQATVVATLSRARRGVLELLQELGRPVTLAALVELSGLHENTVRGHLEWLADEGLVERERASPHGRGRPAWLWRSRSVSTAEYAGLATALARTLRRTSAQPEEDAAEAGRVWGAELARQDRGRLDSSPEARTRGLLEQLGFAPREGEDPDAHGVALRLTQCPFLEVAKEEPAIVCNMHVGLTIGAMAEYGAAAPDAQLKPFAVPGACLLRLDAGRD